MGDLISRSNTIKKLRAYADQKCVTNEIELANGILKAVCFIEEESNIPTAYDVDAVEAEMESFKTTVYSEILEEEVEVINLDRAKAIVLKGGKE